MKTRFRCIARLSTKSLKVAGGPSVASADGRFCNWLFTIQFSDTFQFAKKRVKLKKAESPGSKDSPYKDSEV